MTPNACIEKRIFSIENAKLNQRIIIMIKILKNTLLLLSIILAPQLFAQDNESKALEKATKAVELMDKGKFDESITLLKEAQKLDPERYDYIYELAYAYFLKKEFKSAIKVLQKNKDHASVTDRHFQLLGSCYDDSGESEKALDAFDEGLIKFPKSGFLYLEKGNVFWAKKEYGKAIPFYEKGIEVNPEFPSNYYRAAKIYCNSTEEVWGMLYGEIFMNLERNSARTAEISKLLFDTYKSQIKFTSDTSFSVSFSKNATISLEDLKDPGKFKLPYGVSVYEPTLMFSMLNVKTININTLDEIRTKFLENYYANGHNKTYPNVLFDYQKKLKEQGHLEAYNHWILMKGDEAKFDVWREKNKESWDAFVKWFNDNAIQINESNKFFSDQY